MITIKPHINVLHNPEQNDYSSGNFFTLVIYMFQASITTI